MAGILHIYMATPADIARDTDRAFRESHPWITFALRLDDVSWRFWELLGEARSKCRHLANTPLPPPVASDLSALFLAKGVHATTAIEGNTLTEEEALDAVRGQLELPVGQEYLVRELENIVHACATIEMRIHEGDGRFEVTPQLLRTLNAQVLDGLAVPDHVVPGGFRDGSVVVGGVYRGAPAQDCEILVELLCGWLNGPDFQVATDRVEAFLRAFLRAALAHIYIAWIHPFGDGNGRTARLVEFGILTAAGVPSVTAHLLSNHYNATRSRYYQELDLASKSGGRLDQFLLYAVEGFVGQLQSQLQIVHAVNFEAAWINYVHAQFAGEDTRAPRRQREIVLALPTGPPDSDAAWVPRNRIPDLSPELAREFADKGSKTITRDINAMLKRGLIERGPKGIRARREIMLGFLPRITENSVVRD
jgi:cell filamentation protein, protein adenylyltransferase